MGNNFPVVFKMAIKYAILCGLVTIRSDIIDSVIIFTLIFTRDEISFLIIVGMRIVSIIAEDNAVVIGVVVIDSMRIFFIIADNNVVVIGVVIIVSMRIYSIIADNNIVVVRVEVGELKAVVDVIVAGNR